MNEEFFAPLDSDDARGTQPKGAVQFGRLKQYTVTNLFGSHSHSFYLENHEPTILTGANGTGKSTVLRTIHWISRGEWASLAKVNFTQIRLEFEKAQLIVGRGKGGSALTVRLDRPPMKPRRWEYTPESEHLLPLDRDLLKLFDESSLTDAMDSEKRALLVENSVVLSRYLAHQDRDQKSRGWHSRIHESFPALLVSDQRLTPERRKRPKKRGTGDTFELVAAIEAAVLHISEEVQRYKSLYGTASQNLDRDFPRRVFTAISSQRKFGSERNIEREFREVQELRASLAAAGLIDTAEVEESISDLPLDNPDSLALISTYLSDTKEKLATFEPLRQRLEPFMEFLRRHYKDKIVNIDAQLGLSIFSAKTGERIKPTHLSSGEQQMFVLSHKLLFESSPGTLVMIDEPELSLHVLWQSTLVDDLTEISEVSGTHFLLATHSPTLIAGRTDLRRSLDG
ncbi:AAA family ATPase [Streptomyces milbemycinicus]|uniref:AAA family ATPase n=1 Tax=Streptomyces milbemycinicus TaxID=476552 RepID=A0ABW8LLY5_9ACTN